MKSLTNNQTFNRPDKIIEGWYWAMRSSELKKGVAAPLNFLGRELVVYRGENGRVVALDAYCPHMGAHLADLPKTSEVFCQDVFHSASLI
jgi:phenylpropionate dioxygenase-like ring-hydroxylating dioxygenase large terminal subunit